MIKRFLYVEDGSVDVEGLEESLAEDTKVIVFRQGARTPVVEELDTPAASVADSVVLKQRNEIIKLRGYLDAISNAAQHKNTSKVIKKEVAKYIEDYYC